MEGGIRGRAFPPGSGGGFLRPGLLGGLASPERVPKAQSFSRRARVQANLTRPVVILLFPPLPPPGCGGRPRADFSIEPARFLETSPGDEGVFSLRRPFLAVRRALLHRGQDLECRRRSRGPLHLLRGRRRGGALEDHQ